jgi:UDP-GlcNAc:undecaprenyl-phosphate GlcNAc-1-phosphate transferase
VYWLELFLASFIISSLSSFLLVNWSRKNKKIFRTGGIAIISSFVIVLLFSGIVFTFEWQAILLGSIVILFFGLVDDFRNLNWKRQLVFQLFLSLILIGFGFEINSVSFSGNELFRMDLLPLKLFGISFSLISAFFITFWLMGIINAINWLDGSDGLLSVAGILSLLAVVLVSLRPEVDQPALILVSFIAVGSLAGFFVFNFPKAKLEAGTSGSFFIGFLLAALAIAAGTKIATTMIILILPVTDLLWVILGRARDGKSIFKRDEKNRHLHYSLLKKGFSSRQILFGYSVFLGGALLISFFVVSQSQKIILLLVEFVMIVSVLFMLESNNNLRNKMKLENIFNKPILILILIIGLVLGLNFVNKFDSSFSVEKTVEINSQTIEVKIAQTPEETYQGLSDLKSIPAGTGMLFLYNQFSSCSHVMRGMKFDLDFVFLRDGEVVHLEKDISNNFKGTIKSPEPCNQVLEINLGEIDRLGIKIGDYMSIK